MYMYTYVFFNNLCFHISCVWGVNNRDATGCTCALCHIHIPKVNSVWWETNVSICTANISSYCTQKLWLQLNLGKKMLSDEILLSVYLKGFWSTRHEPVEERRPSQGKTEERWRGLMSAPSNTHILCRCQPLHLCRLIKSKVMETRSGLLDMYNNRKIRPAGWYERSIFFTSNRCHLHAPCSLTHGYLMSTARLSGNLICWPTVVNKKTSHQPSTLHVVLLWFDLIWLNTGCVVCFSWGTFVKF